MPLFECIGDLCIRCWSGIVENLSVDELFGHHSSTDAFAGYSVLKERHSLGIQVQCRLLQYSTNSSDDKARKEYCFCRIEYKITIPSHTKVTVMIQCQSAGIIMKIEILRNIMRRRWSITDWSLMESLPGKPFHLYIENLTAMPVNLSKVMIFAIASNRSCRHPKRAWRCPWRWMAQQENKTHSDKDEDENFINAVRYKLPEHGGEYVDRRSAVKQFEEEFKYRLERRTDNTGRLFNVPRKVFIHVHTVLDHGRWPSWFDEGDEAPNRTRQDR